MATYLHIQKVNTPCIFKFYDFIFVACQNESKERKIIRPENNLAEIINYTLKTNKWCSSCFFLFHDVYMPMSLVVNSHAISPFTRSMLGITFKPATLIIINQKQQPTSFTLKTCAYLRFQKKHKHANTCMHNHKHVREHSCTYT